MDTAEVAVLSELDGIFSLKEKERMALKGFLGGKKTISALLLTHFSKSLVKCCSGFLAILGSNAASSVVPNTNRKPVAKWLKWQQKM